jgi:hAT family protein
MLYNDFLNYTDGVPQANRDTYPTIFAIAMDYLPIQASSVPCERVFSSSAETDTKRRNRINPLLMEALQMLKFQLKKDRLDFTAGWATLEKQMEVDDPEEDLLQKVLQENSVDWDSVIKTINKDDD